VRAILLLLAATLACRATNHTSRPGSGIETPALTKADSAIDSVRARFFSDVEIAARLRPLERTLLPLGTREVRFWLIGGWAISDLYRITSRNGRVDGQWFRFWDFDEGFEAESGLPERAATRYGLAGQCDTIRTFQDEDICITRFVHRPNWAALLGKLESDSVWTLPDQKRNPNIIINDGAEIIVELRDGAHYRKYDYDVTNVREDDVDAKRADAMWADLRTLSSLVPVGANLRIFRGMFLGSPDYPELVSCGSTIPWGLRGKLEALLPLDSRRMRDPSADTLRGSYVELRGTKAYPGLAAQAEHPYPEIITVDSVLLVKPWHSNRCP
jgi:hypothetical protein